MKRLLMILAMLALALPLLAQQDVELREDHPREYVVQEGDTLWDIAGRFLTRPWQWPAIWQANPQVENPHLIFPGDVISLVYVEGEPRLVAERTRRLSPEVRREPLVGPVTTIPLDAIEQFLQRPRILSAEQLDGLPYVVANQEQRVFISDGDRTYVRGLTDARVGEEVTIARLTYQFQDTGSDDDHSGLRANRLRNNQGQVPHWQRPVGSVWQSAERLSRAGVVGYELWEAARARVVRTGDPAIVLVVDADREVTAGDYVLPVDDYEYDLTFHPHAMDRVPEGRRVLATSEAYYGVGHFQIVALGIGSVDGVAPGHVFATFRPGEVIKDRFQSGLRGRPAVPDPGPRRVALPDEYSGQVMVFRAFERVSYGIVLGGRRPVSRDDILYHPDTQY